MPLTVPPEFRAEADKLSPALRVILDAELAAGNSIVEAGSRFSGASGGSVLQIDASGDYPRAKIGRRSELRICARAIAGRFTMNADCILF